MITLWFVCLLLVALTHHIHPTTPAVVSQGPRLVKDVLPATVWWGGSARDAPASDAPWWPASCRSLPEPPTVSSFRNSRLRSRPQDLALTPRLTELITCSILLLLT